MLLKEGSLVGAGAHNEPETTRTDNAGTKTARAAWSIVGFMLACSILLMAWGLMAQQRVWRLEYRVGQLEELHHTEVEKITREVERLDEFWSLTSRNLWVALKTQEQEKNDGKNEDGSTE